MAVVLLGRRVVVWAAERRRRRLLDRFDADVLDLVCADAAPDTLAAVSGGSEREAVGELITRYAESVKGASRDRLTAFVEEHGYVEATLRELGRRSEWRRGRAAKTLGDLGSGSATQAGAGRPRRSQRARAQGCRAGLAAIQVIEYLRAFLTARSAWSRVNALLIVSGAFGVFRADLVRELGGYRVDTVGEDGELVVRIHRHMRERRLPYRVAFVPDPVCWTEAPEELRILRRQRSRWHRGLAEIVSIHRRMIMNPRYGAVGLVALPATVAFELLGPAVEATGIVAPVAGWWIGVLSVPFMVVFALVAVVFGSSCRSRPWCSRRRPRAGSRASASWPRSSPTACSSSPATASCTPPGGSRRSWTPCAATSAATGARCAAAASPGTRSACHECNKGARHLCCVDPPPRRRRPRARPPPASRGGAPLARE